MKDKFEELDWDAAKKSGTPNQYRQELEEATMQEHECTTGKFLSSLNDTLKKDTNPKDSVGVKKAPMSTVSGPVLAELGVAMMEGARKYGRHNYRVAGVQASVYYDAALRHLFSYWEGEDVDPDSGLSHITKCLSTLVVLRDSMIQNTLTDDRPPKAPEGWMIDLNKKAAALIEKYPNAPKACTEKIDVV